MQFDTIPSKKREDYVDVLKAFAIFLVVLGHSKMLFSGERQLIYAFHMPLFFIIYGITYNLTSHSERGFCSKQFLIGKFKRLYVPCLLWAIVYSQFSFKNLVLDVYATQTTLSMSSSLTSLWFLSCMFVATIVFELICGFSFRRKWSTLAEIILCLIVFWGGYLLPKIKYGYPLCVDIALVAVLLIMTGHQVFRRLSTWLKQKKTWIVGAIALGTGLLSIFLYPFNLSFLGGYHNVDMASGNYGNIILFYVTSVVASVCFLCIALLVVRVCSSGIVMTLVNIGGNTLGILVLHKPIILLLSRVVYASGVANKLVVSVVGLVASALVGCVCYWIANKLKRHIPILFGE